MYELNGPARMGKSCESSSARIMHRSGHKEWKEEMAVLLVGKSLLTADHAHRPAGGCKFLFDPRIRRSTQCAPSTMPILNVRRSSSTRTEGDKNGTGLARLRQNERNNSNDWLCRATNRITLRLPLLTICVELHTNRADTGNAFMLFCGCRLEAAIPRSYGFICSAGVYS